MPMWHYVVGYIHKGPAGAGAGLGFGRVFLHLMYPLDSEEAVNRAEEAIQADNGLQGIGIFSINLLSQTD